jgi:hypothetical protein
VLGAVSGGGGALGGWAMTPSCNEKEKKDDSNGKDKGNKQRLATVIGFALFASLVCVTIGQTAPRRR